MKTEYPYPSQAVIDMALENLSSSSVVLDVGCNQGLMGKILREKTGCKVLGIDKSPLVLSRAKKVLDSVILADIDNDNINVQKASIDLIILSNILEHLVDPLATIKSLIPLLKPIGFFLIALPNIAFWPIRLDLLFGRFDYRNEGILNKDHLRFFTLKTFKQLLAEADLEIVETTTNYLGLRGKIARLWPTLLASQFNILCKNHGLFPGKNKKFRI